MSDDHEHVLEGAQNSPGTPFEYMYSDDELTMMKDLGGTEAIAPGVFELKHVDTSLLPAWRQVESSRSEVISLSFVVRKHLDEKSRLTAQYCPKEVAADTWPELQAQGTVMSDDDPELTDALDKLTIGTFDLVNEAHDGEFVRWRSCDGVTMPSSSAPNDWRAIVHPSPIALGHTLLFLHMMEELTQVISPDMLRTGASLLNSVERQDCAVGYNSIGSGAVANALHFEMVFEDGLFAKAARVSIATSRPAHPSKPQPAPGSTDSADSTTSRDASLHNTDWWPVLQCRVSHICTCVGAIGDDEEEEGGPGGSGDEDGGGQEGDAGGRQVATIDSANGTSRLMVIHDDDAHGIGVRSEDRASDVDDAVLAAASSEADAKIEDGPAQEAARREGRMPSEEPLARSHSEEDKDSDALGDTVGSLEGAQSSSKAGTGGLNDSSASYESSASPQKRAGTPAVDLDVPVMTPSTKDHKPGLETVGFTPGTGGPGLSSTRAESQRQILQDPALLRERLVDVYNLEGWPVHGFLFCAAGSRGHGAGGDTAKVEGMTAAELPADDAPTSAASIASICDVAGTFICTLLEQNIPHNIFINRNPTTQGLRVIVFARKLNDSSGASPTASSRNLNAPPLSANVWDMVGLRCAASEEEFMKIDAEAYRKFMGRFRLHDATVDTITAVFMQACDSAY